MEPPAKRARHGRAPHDDFSDFSMPMDYNSKNIGFTKGEAGKDGNDEADDKDDEDEIAMDPEDYAMKLNPQYRFQKSRAVADNKLKSAFELLFEKYSKDFGDTGDEINFYTDEIEVDNGHITSILAEEEDENEDDEDARRNGRNAEELGRGLSLLTSGPVLTAREEPAADESTSEPKPVVLGDEHVDPAWAAPAIPDDAFTTPKPHDHAINPPRIVCSVPHRSIFRKSLPESFGKVASAKTDKTGKETATGGRRKLDTNDNDDDLLMDTSEPILKFSNSANTPRRRVSNWAGPSPGKTTTAESPSMPPRSGTLLTATSAPAISPPLPPPPPSSVLSNVAQPNGIATALPATSSTSIPGGMAPKPTINGNTETFSRNTLDPNYAFSDDEDFGLKRRNTVPKPAPQHSTEAGVVQSNDGGIRLAAAQESSTYTTSTPTTETKKRGPGRPRVRPIKPPSEKRRSVGRHKSTKDPVRSQAIVSPRPTADTPTSSKPPSQDPTPVQVQPQPVSEQLPQSVPALPQKRRVGRPRKIRTSEDDNAASSTPTSRKISGQEDVLLSSPQPMSVASTPSKPPTQELPKELPKEPLPAAQAPEHPPQKRRVGRPKKIRGPDSTDIQMSTPAGTPTGREVANGLEQVALSSPQPMSIVYTPSKPPTQEAPQELQQELPQEPPQPLSEQPQKRRVGRPRKVKDTEVDKPSTQAHSSPSNGPTKRPASATPTPSKSPAQVLSPPLWQSVTQLQQKRRVGRPRKVVAVDVPAPSEPVVNGQEAQATPGTTSNDPKNAPQPPSQELPQQPLPLSASQPLSQALPHLSKSSTPQKSGRAEIPDSQATNASSNTNISTANRTYGLRSSLRSEIPDSEANLPSSIITLVSDDDDDDGNNNGNESDYDAVQAAISSQLVGLRGSRLSPARSSPARLSPARLSPARLSPTRRSPSRLSPAAVTPLTTARFVVIPRSGTESPVGAGSGRASPLAKSVLRTPSPVKFMKSKLSSASKLLSAGQRLDNEAAHAMITGAPSPSGSVVQTPGGTMRRCGQDGFRCEREFCFRCA
ncbi:myb-like dna-binding domain protein [Ophiostoma piceae UAMH 11346]|uniref:Myb-like dna-binding domain protein n=1 Tax=Ophiostoma piceae (strain UAMH 11346) TaxID=1262450 RepID=S3BTP4_OPHP1|nr:myb-like dna-binding domain protein [Ophiostoma piceae UAMH 11346]